MFLNELREERIATTNHTMALASRRADRVSLGSQPFM
jgi:hypothetical protein